MTYDANGQVKLIDASQTERLGTLLRGGGPCVPSCVGIVTERRFFTGRAIGRNRRDDGPGRRGRGSNLATAVTKFGVPKELAPCRSCREGAERFHPQPQSDDCVQFGYGSYGLLLQESIVRGCVFLPGWQEAVHGVKLGDSQADVVKALGDQFQESRSRTLGPLWEPRRGTRIRFTLGRSPRAANCSGSIGARTRKPTASRFGAGRPRRQGAVPDASFATCGVAGGNRFGDSPRRGRRRRARCPLACVGSAETPITDHFPWALSEIFFWPAAMDWATSARDFSAWSARPWLIRSRAARMAASAPWGLGPASLGSWPGRFGPGRT